MAFITHDLRVAEANADEVIVMKDGQIAKQGPADQVFAIRLKPDEWTSAKINWLLDVIALDQKTTVQVIANFQQVKKDGELRLHPIITRLVDKETHARIQKFQIE